MSLEIIHFGGAATVHKFTDEQVAESAYNHGLTAVTGNLLLADHPDHDIVEGGHNNITTAGLTRLVSLLAGAGGTAITATTARIGVGNGTTGFSAADTDLSAASGSSNRQFVTMDSTYPSASAAVLTLQSTFTSGLANFHWQEWGIDIATATVANGTTVGTTLFNRKVVDLGTKATGSWVLQVTITES